MSYKPYVTKLKGSGQCTFIYMSASQAEEYEKVLLAYEANKSSLPKDFDGEMALGLSQNPATKRWEIVTIKFNVLTNSSSIVSIKDVAGSKAYANAEFKKELMKLKIV